MPSDPASAEAPRSPRPPTSDGRVRRARDLRARRREQLLDAARRVFAAKGYQHASIHELLTEAGVSRGTFYQYFDSKRACFSEVLGGFVDRLRAAIAPVDIRAATPPREQLLANLIRVLTILEEDADLTRFLLQQARGADPELEETVDAFDRRVLALIVGSLTTGTRLGLVRPGDIEMRASFVLGALKEAVSQTILGRAEARPRDALARQLLDFTLRGVLVEPGAV